MNVFLVTTIAIGLTIIPARIVSVGCPSLAQLTRVSVAGSGLVGVMIGRRRWSGGAVGWCNVRIWHHTTEHADWNPSTREWHHVVLVTARGWRPVDPMSLLNMS